jgi:glyceraldehyde 3-phosphate dehydrogenase
MARIAIHGFGRIGRSLMKVALKNDLFFPVSISDIKDVPTLAALFEVDSNYGRWPVEVTTKDGEIDVICGYRTPWSNAFRWPKAS